jgi:hypothetical protein
MGSEAASFLPFINPLSDAISVLVTMEKAATKSDFYLMTNRRTRYIVGAQERLDIPFSYSPSAMVSSMAKIVLEINPQVKWIYPIKVSQ